MLFRVQISITPATDARPVIHCCPACGVSFPLQLVVTTLESKFRTYDMRTQHPTEGFAHLSEKAHKSTVWIARHLPQNRDLFMTGGGNGGFNLYKYHYPISRVKQDKVWHRRGTVRRNVQKLTSSLQSCIATLAHCGVPSCWRRNVVPFQPCGW